MSKNLRNFFFTFNVNKTQINWLRLNKKPVFRVNQHYLNSLVKPRIFTGKSGFQDLFLGYLKNI